MEDRNGVGDSELAAWATPLFHAEGPTSYPTRDLADRLQHSRDLSSQSLRYQPCQPALFSSADDSCSATPYLSSHPLEKTTALPYAVTPTPQPPPPSALLPQQPSLQQTRAVHASRYTVSSLSTVASLTVQQQRSADDLSITLTSTPGLTHTHTHNDEVQALKCSSPSSYALPRPSKAAAFVMMSPLCVAHPSCTSDDTDVGGDLEIKGPSLEKYLDFPDDDDDSDVGNGRCAEGNTVYPGRRTSDGAHSCSQHYQPPRPKDRRSLWMTDLCDMAGDGSSYSNNNNNDSSRRTFSNDKPRYRSPCTPIEVEMRSRGHRGIVIPSGASAGAAAMGARPCAASVKRVRPPPLSGFTPVAAVVSSATPPEMDTGAHNRARHTHSSGHSVGAVSDGQHDRSTTPPSVSLSFSSKVSSIPHQGFGALMDEERRLKDIAQVLRKHLAETEQKLAHVQSRMAESSFNSAVAGTVGLEAHQFAQKPSLQVLARMAPAESRPLDPAAAATPAVHLVPRSTAPHYTVGVSPTELLASPPQQPQHMASSSTSSRMYVSSTPSSPSTTAGRPPRSDVTGPPSSGGMAYFLQSSAPFGVYAVPSAGTPVDAAAGNTAPENGAATAAGALFAAPAPSGGPTVQVLAAPPYMVNSQPTVCYMVLPPQAQPPQLAVSGAFTTSMPPPEFGSINSNNSVGSGHVPMKGGTLTPMPMLSVTALASAAAAATAATAKTPEVQSNYSPIVMVGPASNVGLTRKCFNVHGSMMGVVQYFPYDENAPPAPTATILTAAVSPSASVSGQSMSGSAWSTRLSNGCGADPALSNSYRSNDGGGVTPRSYDSSTPPRNARDTPTSPSDLSSAPVQPIFIQMFPCELYDRATVLNRVMEATCGRDFGVVQRIEPRSKTSFIAHVRTYQVWHLIYRLRCRVLMDRFGFWYAADLDQYIRMKEYCEEVRHLPQQTRHFQTDGLPCMPLVVELSRAVDKAALTENNAPRTFDEIVPMVAVERHRTRHHAAATATAATAESAASNTKDCCGSVGGFAPTTLSSSGALTETTVASSVNTASYNTALVLLTSAPSPHWSAMAATASEVSFLTSVSSLNGSIPAGPVMPTEARPPRPPLT